MHTLSPAPQNERPTEGRRTRTLVGRGATVLLLLLALAAAAGCRKRDFLPPVSVTPTLGAISDPKTADLFSVSMRTPTDGWAVGAQGTILRYDGKSWQPVQSPTNVYLLGVSMSSASDGWIVGASHYVGDKQKSTVLHYTNQHWSMVDADSTSYLDAIQMLTPDEGWAVGKDILRLSGGTWRKAPNPDGGTLSRSGIAMTSSTNGWAVSNQGFLMHYDGSAWSAASAPDATRKLYAISMASPTDGWAVGASYTADGQPSGTLLMHFANGAWTPVPETQEGFLYSVSMISPTDGWAVGSHGLVLHYDGTTWTAANSPTPFTLRSVSMASPTEGWAVGAQGTIIHYANGTWSQVQR